MKALKRLLLTVGLLMGLLAQADAGEIYLHAVQAHYPASGGCTQVFDTSGTAPYYKANCTANNTTVYFHLWYPADAGTTWTPTYFVRNETVSSGFQSCWRLQTAVAKGSNIDYNSLVFGNSSSNALLLGTDVLVTGHAYIAGGTFTPFNGVNGISCDATCRNQEMIIKVTQNATGTCTTSGLSSLVGLRLSYN